MTEERLQLRFREACHEQLPRLGGGLTAERFSWMFEMGREDLSLAKLAEAHWDAVAILAEAGREPEPGKTYAVWASERPGTGLILKGKDSGIVVDGRKAFCSGAGLVDRALVSTSDERLVEVDLRLRFEQLAIDETAWCVDAFRMTHTATVTFTHVPVVAVLGDAGWYTARAGFWQGAIGPAAAWAGGATGLVDFAAKHARDDAHSYAHLAAMQAHVFAMKSVLRTAGDHVDRFPDKDAMVQALMVRHLVEQSSTDILRRFTRMLGPVPLAMNHDIARRYAEVDLFLRQSHAERDLEALGRALHAIALAG